jgi:hypothetical protein
MRLQEVARLSARAHVGTDVDACAAYGAGVVRLVREAPRDVERRGQLIPQLAGVRLHHLRVGDESLRAELEERRIVTGESELALVAVEREAHFAPFSRSTFAL